MKVLSKKKNLIRNPNFKVTLEVKARKRGSEVSDFKVDVDEEPEFAKLFWDIAKCKPGRKGLPNSLRRHQKVIEEAAGFIEKTEVTNTVLPHCRLSKDLLSLIPSDLKERAQKMVREKTLLLSPDIRIQRGKNRPEGFATIPPRNEFPKGGNILWVLDRGTHMWSAYQITNTLARRLQEIKTGHAGVKDLDTKMQELLFLGNILTTQALQKQRLKHWAAEIALAAKSISSKQYAVVRNVLPPLQVAVLRKYFRELEREGYLKVDHQQVREMRFKLENEAVCRFVHRQSSILFRKITREQVIPSFTYFSAYKEGSSLKRHTDRPQCKWNGSLMVDTSIDGATWPIFLEVNKKKVAIKLDLGDLVIYSGEKVPHWRPKIARGLRQSFLLLLFVPIEFTGSLD